MRFLVVASLLAASAAPVSAALVLDQNSFITPVGATLTGSSLTSFALGSGPNEGRFRQQVQSLTVDVAGQLTRVDFQLYRNAMTSTLLEVTVARGTFGDSGYAPVGSFTQAVTATQADILAGGFTALDVSGLGLAVMPGDVLNFHLSTSLPASGGSQLFWVIGEPGPNPGDVVNAPILAGGAAQITLNGGASWQSVPTDRSLRTYVETASTAVPEPDSWALLIAGFGLSGAMLRRRRLAIAGEPCDIYAVAQSPLPPQLLPALETGDFRMSGIDDDDYGSSHPAPHIEPIPAAEAEDAVRTLIRWAGDDPDREGLLDTPGRVTRAYREYFRGYQEDPGIHLATTFGEVGGYDEIVILRDIPFQSHCEHHMAPIIGKAHIAYLPRKRVVGISKLARVLHGFAKRMQVQERLTAEVADCIQKHLDPVGVAVVIEASHACMSARGVMTQGVTMTTSRMMGVFRDDDRSRKEVLSLMGKG